MKIAIFTDAFLPQINGIVTSIIDIAKGMTDKGHKVYIIAPVTGLDDEEFKYKDIEVLRVPAVDASFYTGFKWSAVFHKSTYNILKKADIDIVHFMTPVTISVFGILVAKFLKKPMIGTYHTFISEITYLRQLFPFAGPLTQKFAWKYSNSFYNRAHLITTPSEFTTQELARNGCKPKIITVSNGIRLDSFDNTNADKIKKKYNPDGELILYVGRISPEKNMICLLTAFRDLCKTDKTTKMLMIGGGPSVDECKVFAKHEGLEDRVIFLGLVPNKELKTSGIFGACRLFATASNTENQPVTILEAKANGLPCVGPDAMGMPGVIINGKDGIIVEKNNSDQLRDAMASIINDDELHKKYSNACLEYIKDHEINLIIDQWEDRYKDLISKVKRKRRHRVLN